MKRAVGGALIGIAWLGAACATHTHVTEIFNEAPRTPPGDRYAISAQIDPPKVIDNDGGLEEGAADMSSSLQAAMTNECQEHSSFLSCTTKPNAKSWLIGTEVVIDDYNVDNTVMAVIGGTLLPPLLGMLWSFPLFLGGCEGKASWTLKDTSGREVVSWSMPFDTNFCNWALADAGGFPKFLESANGTMLAELGPPQTYNGLARAPAPAPEVAPPPAAPRANTGPKVSASVVAVFDMQDASGKLDPSLLDQLTEYLGAQLVERAGFRVVPRSEVRNRLAAEKKESYGSCFDESCQIELGKALAAEKSLATKLLRIGSTCAISATLYDLRSETTVAASTVEGECGDDALMKSVRGLAEKLSR